MSHKWTKNDDIVAFYLYRFNMSGFNFSIEEIAEQLGMSKESLKMRINNFKAVDGRGGLKNYAKLTKEVFFEFKSLSKKEHLAEVKRILNL